METKQICADCREVFCADTGIPRRCLSCQQKEVPDDTEVNYSRPEQPSRKFDRGDVERLKASLDNDIRRLEGMRGVEFDRNYLHSGESNELNRAKLTRMIVEQHLKTKE